MGCPTPPRGEDSDLFKPARNTGRGDLEALSIPDEPIHPSKILTKKSPPPPRQLNPKSPTNKSQNNIT